MPRIITRQAAVARPIRIFVSGIAVEWTTILEAPDFSVPDSTKRWPDERDPADTENRRIQPGQVEVEAPLLFHNTHATISYWVEIRTLTEADASVVQARHVIPPRQTYAHIPAQTLLKRTIASANGDRLQVRAEVAGVIHLTGVASEGAAEQHEPVGAA